jgi:membrane-associated phospholipid phosphatase
MVYIVGIIGYALFPAWGPFISDAARLAQSPWHDGSWRIVGIQSVIHANTQAVLQHQLDFGRIPPYAFVAAMPSLHIAIPALGLFLFRGRPGMQMITLTFCLLTVFATLLTGMHYGVDLLAGILIAWLACLGTSLHDLEDPRA